MPTGFFNRDPYGRLRNSSGRSDYFTRLFISYSGIEDTWIDSGAATTNYDTNVYLFCSDTRRTLLRPDLSSIIAGSEFKSVRLKLYSTKSSPDDVTLMIHRILEANSGWVESSATWNTIDGVTAWAGSVGCSTEGVDYSATPLYSGTCNAAYGSWDLIDLDTTEFKEVLAANYGMIIISVDPDSHERRWTSENQASEYYRPYMLIEYSGA